MPKSYIIVAALKAETPNLEQFAPIIHTGVGKLNAAIKLYKAIQEYQPELVINYGTAGSISGVNGLLRVETFVQRDMDVQALNFPKGVTPFSGEVLPEKKGVVLGTGDNFITNAKEQLKGLEIEIDLVDMEGYALKKVADDLNVPFESYKYVSDNANEEAAQDWTKTVREGAKSFLALLEKKYGKSSLLDKVKIHPKNADYFIKKLALEKHPEGGYFKEIYRSQEKISKASLPARFSGDRNFSTCIYFLLNKQDFSSFHKIQQDELWHFYEGSTLQMHFIDLTGNYHSIRLGRNLEQGEQMQYTVPSHTWMAAEVIDKTSYSLIGATVAPGFDFADFEMPTAETLINQYPQHQKIISRLTKP